jgi:hypothetical protein
VVQHGVAEDQIERAVVEGKRSRLAGNRVDGQA